MNPYGIDFGTTNSVLAQWNGREVEVLSIDTPPSDWEQLEFDKVLPSVVGVSPDGHRTTFGWAAKRQQESKLETVKRLFATEEFVDLGGSRVSVEEAAALLFGHLRTASAGIEVDRAVVTIPANSRGLARYRTKLCAGLAGIDVQALVNEPTAAAMAYAADTRRDQNILVFDWGGGTLDVTVLETIEGVFIERASKGIPRSGGIDLDAAFAKAIRDRLPHRPSWSPAQETQFRLAVERAKILLSSQESTNIALPDGQYIEVDRALFERSIKHLLEDARQPILQCLRDLEIGPEGIDQLVMVGGSSKIPAARRLVSETVGRAPATGCDPMTAVAQGAAIASAILLGQLDKDFFVATEHALGTIVHDDNQRPRFSVLIPRNRQLPAKESDSYIPAAQGQRAVRVRVIEGDPAKEVSDPDNVVLKEWSIDVDPELTQQENAFDISYEYNVDGILHITVTNTRTGRVMLRDDVSFGVTKDKTQLIDLANRVRATIGSGRAPAGLTVSAPAISAPALDSATVRLLERARNKVVPFVGEDEGRRLEELCVEVERAAGAASDECREALERKLRQYAYLF